MLTLRIKRHSGVRLKGVLTTELDSCWRLGATQRIAVAPGWLDDDLYIIHRERLLGMISVWAMCARCRRTVRSLGDRMTGVSTAERRVLRRVLATAVVPLASRSRSRSRAFRLMVM
jgi:hypothetical protein